MNEDIDEGVQIFVTEAGELLEQMESALFELEEDLSNDDHINAVFRAVHTIKGSAGLFAYNHVVGFTHSVESVLDRARTGEQEITTELLTLLFACHDVMERLVEAAVRDQDSGDEAVREKTRVITEQLDPYLNGRLDTRSELDVESKADDTNTAISEEESVADDLISSIGLGGNWHISLRFGNNVLRNGMDPLSFVRYLTRLGNIVNLITVWDDMPGKDEIDPESCYLDLEIEFKSDADKKTIEDVFQFVQDDCKICIFPPLTRLSLYKEVIEELVNEQMRLGEILVESGAVTEREVNEALEEQQCELEQANQQGKNTNNSSIGEVLLRKGVVHPELVQIAIDKQEQLKKNVLAEKSIRVNTKKLESLINLVGELVISSANTTLLVNLTSKDVINDALIESAENMGQLVDDVRDMVLGLRMVQIYETFNRFRRVVRDVSQQTGKDIEFKISGGETELDKIVVEKIGDPLMHLVRNAIDHGIETAEERQEKGKSARGLLHLNAYHESGSIIIEVSDDGYGLSRERILGKALKMGLIDRHQDLSDQEVYRLIFEPGFSTAEEVTDLSGRGVGMDVVRRNIEILRGQVNVESYPGKGAKFSIRLPLTLAIIDGFLVRVGQSFYVIPLDMVEECMELPEEVQGANQLNNYMNLRGEVLPFIHLADLFQVKNEQLHRENIVVAQFAGKRAGLVVGELHGEYQTVIKPMGKVFNQLDGISGATILDSGEVAMIIDVPALVQRAALSNVGKFRCSNNTQVQH